MSPEAFRRELRLNENDSQPFGEMVQPWQETDFAGLDAGWRQLAGFSIPEARRRAYIERPRGHSKTSDMAMQIAWILLFAKSPVNGLAAAADLDQALLIHTAVRRLASLNPTWLGGLRFKQQSITHPRTGSELRVITSDARSSYGVLPDFVICDELCHWERPDLWESLLSSAAKRPNSVLAILTNAGVGRGWQWEVREAARKNPAWYFSSLAGPVAPWIREEDLAEQQALLPPSIFNRLWRNEWQEATGEFVTLPEAEACRNPQLVGQTQGQPGVRYWACIDYAEKHDNTVAVIVHREGSRIVVDRMDVARPTPETPVKVQWVEDWIRWAGDSFAPISFVIDDYQLIGVIQRLSPWWDLRRVQFQGGRANHLAAMVLRRLILQREIVWYPGCGHLDVPWGRDDLETELASLIWRQNASGRYRFDHHRDSRHHDDRAFALAMACLELQEEEGGSEWLEVNDPGTGWGW